MPLTIPAPSQSDKDRDALEDYDYGSSKDRVYSSALLAWIRLAVAYKGQLDALLATGGPPPCPHYDELHEALKEAHATLTQVCNYETSDLCFQIRKVLGI